MKKLLAIFLSLIIITAGLVSCKENGENTNSGESVPESSQPGSESADLNQMTAAELLGYASQKNASAESVTMNMDAEITVGSAGEEMNIVENAVIKIEGPKGTNPKMSMNMSMDFGTGAVTFTSTFIDGYYYTDMTGEKLKAQVTAEELGELMGSAFFKAEDIEIMDDEKLEKTEASGGGWIVTCPEINLAGFSDIFDSIIGLYNMDQSESELNFGDMSLEMNIDKDGNIVSADISYAISMTIENETVDMAMVTSVTFSDYGATSVSAPENAAEYSEVDYSDLAG